MTTPFTGEIHPAAEGWYLMSDDEASSLADDISANGLIDPITLTHDGQLVDGRNRLAACSIAEVKPTFTWLAEDADPYAFACAKNERRNLTPGQQAMGRAITAQAQGKRKAGRWERGTVDNGDSSISAAWVQHMKHAGYILDVAAKAKAMEPGNGITQENLDEFVVLPNMVRDKQVALDAAYRKAQLFENIAGLAEAIAYKPLTDWLGVHEELGNRATTQHGTPPEQGTLPPLRRKDVEQINRAKKQYTAAAAILNNLLREQPK